MSTCYNAFRIADNKLYMTDVAGVETSQDLPATRYATLGVEFTTRISSPAPTTGNPILYAYKSSDTTWKPETADTYILSEYPIKTSYIQVPSVASSERGGLMNGIIEILNTMTNKDVLEDGEYAIEGIIEYTPYYYLCEFAGNVTVQNGVFESSHTVYSNFRSSFGVTYKLFLRSFIKVN